MTELVRAWRRVVGYFRLRAISSMLVSSEVMLKNKSVRNSHFGGLGDPHPFLVVRLSKGEESEHALNDLLDLLRNLVVTASQGQVNEHVFRGFAEDEPAALSHFEEPGLWGDGGILIESFRNDEKHEGVFNGRIVGEGFVVVEISRFVFKDPSCSVDPYGGFTTMAPSCRLTISSLIRNKRIIAAGRTRGI